MGNRGAAEATSLVLWACLSPAMLVCQVWKMADKKMSSFRGALLREPGIHNHDREYGFRACAKKAHPGMTKYVREAFRDRDVGAKVDGVRPSLSSVLLTRLFEPR